jgi:hypothetical protein
MNRAVAARYCATQPDGRIAVNKLLAACAVLGLAISGPAFSGGKVIEARFGRNVADRTIVDQTTAFAPGEKACLWLKVEGASGETLSVNWSINQQSYPVGLAIGGSPWRTWASKTLHVAGEWTVTVTDGSGAILYETGLTVK